MTTKTTTIKPGAYIRERHGLGGRVTKVETGPCPEGITWFDIQQPPLPDDLYDTVWIHALIDPKGSILAPASTVTEIEPFPFVNPWADESFPTEAN